MIFYRWRFVEIMARDTIFRMRHNRYYCSLLTTLPMARVTNNLLLQGISGKIGPLVVRQVGGQTIVQSAETKAQRAPRSPRQQAHLDRMYQAQLYAKAQIRDPSLKALYATRIDQRRTSAYTVAIADYMKAPGHLPFHNS